MVIIVGIGLYCFKKNKTHEDYYVGGRDISSTHVSRSLRSQHHAFGAPVSLDFVSDGKGK
ncbi:MAG: hypothetical protein OEL75_01625 [Kiritimatiellaceae bacterium]|nr:hypothetical protein [Kiritimatiellaceae bacterium]